MHVARDARAAGRAARTPAYGWSLALPLPHRSGKPTPGGQSGCRTMTLRRGLRPGWPLLLAVVTGALSAGPSDARSDPCNLVSVGVDTSYADNDVGVLCGEAPGETFLAADTLVHSITVWRDAVETPRGVGFKLWITRVDSVSGIPRKGQVVLEGPVIYVPFGDGVHPIKMEYLFDPPFALPGPGRYWFAVQDYCGSHWDLLVTSQNVYPDGGLWRSGETCLDGCNRLRQPDDLSAYDLVFTIEFCRDTVTAAHRTSWGQLKTIYR